MRLERSIIAAVLLLIGCASTKDTSISDARRPTKVGQSLIRLADSELLEMRASLWPYSHGTGSRWIVRLTAQSRPDTLNFRWSADLGEIAETLPQAPYMADVKVHRDRIAIFTPWNSTSSVIDRADGWLLQRASGRSLFDRAEGEPQQIAVRLLQGQSGSGGSGGGGQYKGPSTTRGSG